jgi:penicillin-binding protein 1A
MEKGYGSALALPIWVDFMQNVPEKGYPAAPFQAPVPLTKVRLCSASGARATGGCESTRTAYEASLPAQRIPGSACSVHPEPVPVYAAQQPYPGTASAVAAPLNPGGSLTAVPPQSASSAARVGNASVAPAAAPSPTQAAGIAAALPQRQSAPSVVEQTGSGTRIYHADGITVLPPPAPPPSRQTVGPSEQSRSRVQTTATPMPVMRAIPVQPSDRVPISDSVRDPGARVLRAQPVVRERAPAPRAVRGRVGDDEEF